MNTKLLISIFLIMLIYSHGWSQLANGKFSIGGSIDFVVGTSEQSYNE